MKSFRTPYLYKYTGGTRYKSHYLFACLSIDHDVFPNGFTDEHETFQSFAALGNFHQKRCFELRKNAKNRFL